MEQTIDKDTVDINRADKAQTADIDRVSQKMYMEQKTD